MFKSHALIKFVDGEFGVIKLSDIFFNDPDDTMDFEKEYEIGWGEGKIKGVVKFMGTELAYKFPLGLQNTSRTG